MRRGGFTLIELLVVVAVIVTLVGASLGSIIRRDDREAAVKAAADGLASLLRATRAKAVERYASYAVCFNLENAPGSDGRQLNNGSGGHWYRVMGPATMAGTGMSFPPFFARNTSSLTGAWLFANFSGGENPVRNHLAAVAQCWEGDRHVLPAGKVRFVALTDEDNGDYAVTGRFAATYPRPWFGWFDAAAGRLRPWGGYDPAIPGTRSIAGGARPSFTGFYYEGDDGPVSGCLHQADRQVRDDTTNDGNLTAADDPAARLTLWKAGAPRPLIDADWQDFMIVFRPDGTAWTDWMRLRHGYGYSPGNFAYPEIAMGDRCNLAALSAMAGTGREASDFASRSGFHWLTLGPDVDGHGDAYASVDAAMASLMPLYRVGVGVTGEVRVVRVVDSDSLGRIPDPVLAGPAWNVQATTDQFYRGLLRCAADGSRWGTPITGVLTRAMLLDRTMWWAP